MSGVCQCCGQTMPRDYLIVGTRMRLDLTGMKQIIFEAVTKAGPEGIHAEVLFERCYSGTSKGGPDSGVKIIAVHVRNLNKKLAAYGKKVTAGKGLRFYQLVDI